MKNWLCILKVMQKVKTTEITETIFESYGNFIQGQINQLAHEVQQQLNLKGLPRAIRFNGQLYFVTNPKNEPEDKIVSVPKELRDHGRLLEKSWKKACDDVKFFQMWLSFVLKERKEETVERMPQLLINQLPEYKQLNYQGQCFIPKGWEDKYKRAEAMIQYCLGLKLLQ